MAVLKIKNEDGSWTYLTSGTGEDGYTPVRGVDYWTEEDIAAIQAYVDEAILNGKW